MKAIGYIASTILLVAYSAVMSGWALSKLWLWFIVATFHMAPLSIPAAIGVALIVCYLTSTIAKNDDDETLSKAMIRFFFYATFKPLFALAFGAIVRLWM